MSVVDIQSLAQSEHDLAERRMRVELASFSLPDKLVDDLGIQEKFSEGLISKLGLEPE